MRQVLEGATRLRVRTGGTCCRSEAEERTIFEEKNPDEIKRLVENLQVDEQKSGFHCMCCGDPTLEFYKGDSLIAMIGFHHGRSLRWPGGWPADALMKAGFAEVLINWLDARGAGGPRRETDAAAQRDRASKRKFDRATSTFSDDCARAFTTGKEEFLEVLKKEFPKTEDQLLAVLRVFGANNSSWSILDWIDQRAEVFLKGATAEQLEVAVEKALSGDDRQTRRGAARVCAASFLPLKNWNPRNKQLYKAALAVMQEARDSSVRKDAIESLREWAPRMDPAEVAKVLGRSLVDPDPIVREKAIVFAGEERVNAVLPHLLNVMDHKKIDIVPLEKATPSELEDTEELFSDSSPSRIEVPRAALLWPI